MKKFIFLFAILMIQGHLLTGQDAKLQKKLDKANKYLEAGKLDKADKYLQKTLNDYTWSGKAWDLLVKTHLYQYNEVKALPNPFANFTITVESKGDSDVDADSLTESLTSLFQNMAPADIALRKAQFTMRLATLYTNEAYMTSIYQRNYMVDELVDSTVSESAWQFFYKAEYEFQNKNFHEAAQYYQKALDISPDFYKASLYLGDSYYRLEYYNQAIEKFKKAIERFPDELEPRKYLTDAYANSGLYEKALEEAIESLEVFPDLVMVAKVQYLARKNGYDYDIIWTPRQVFPNVIGNGNAKTHHAVHVGDQEALGPWVYYKAAMYNVLDDSNEKGIIAMSEITDSRYLEVYSWEEMLRNSDDPILDEARRMQELGFLDCYVLVTCFHYDLYDQYLDLTRNNPGRVEAYLKAMLKPQ